LDHEVPVMTFESGATAILGPGCERMTGNREVN